MKMSFKQSEFNIIVTEFSDGRLLIFNSLRCTFGIMDGFTKELYEKIESISMDALQNQKERDAVSVMSENGFIVPLDFDEKTYIEIENQRMKFDKSALVLTIAPTLECNMACPYCYETKRSGPMSEEIQEALFLFVEKELNNPGTINLHVTWYGGEPLLAVDLIQSLSSRFIELCKKKEVKYSASIVTNGVLLNRETALILQDCKVTKAQITIDGMPEYHNKRRVLKDGSESFERIVDNVESAKDLLEIAIRVNLDEGNEQGIHDLLWYLSEEKKWGKNPAIYVAPVVKYTEADYFKNNCAISKQSFSEIEAALIARTYGEDKETVSNQLFPQRKSCFCQATVYNAYVIDSEGFLYKCWNEIGNKEEAVGILASANQMSPSILKWLSYKPDEKCWACQFLPICLGGCPYQFHKKGEHDCGNIKEITLARLRKAYQQYIEIKEAKENHEG